MDRDWPRHGFWLSRGRHGWIAVQAPDTVTSLHPCRHLRNIDSFRYAANPPADCRCLAMPGLSLCRRRQASRWPGRATITITTLPCARSPNAWPTWNAIQLFIPILQNCAKAKRPDARSGGLEQPADGFGCELPPGFWKASNVNAVGKR